jgi:hypothetical protein
MNWDHAPKQTDGLEINQLPDGYIVYQADRDRVHYLNPSAVLVLELCTGTVSADDIPRLLKDAYRLVEVPTAYVAECLATLLNEGLIR